MTVFRPPTDNIVPPVYVGAGGEQGIDLPSHYADTIPAMHKLMRHYKSGARGRNVFLMQDNSVTEVQPPNWDPNNPTGPISSGYNPFTQTTDSVTLPASQQVKKVFWGGTDNPVTAAEVTILTAAGYGPNLI